MASTMRQVADVGSKVTTQSQTPTGIVKSTARKTTKDSKRIAKRIAKMNRKSSRLLRLPAELRNRIYNYAEDDEITVTNQTREPPLLHVCRQIRNEGEKMYYLENDFYIHVEDCDARLVIALGERVNGMAGGDSLKLEMTFSGQPDWDNLMTFCEAVHEGNTWHTVSAGSSGYHMAEVIAAATKIASQLRGLPWKVCREVIESVRPLAEQGDVFWEQEK